MLEITQEKLESVLFELMAQYDYGPSTVSLYTMMSRCAIPHLLCSLLIPRSHCRFHHNRIPLIVLIGGTACTGKSFLATQLAERLNLHSVLQSAITFELMRGIAPYAHTLLGFLSFAPLLLVCLGLFWYIRFALSPMSAAPTSGHLLFPPYPQ